MIKLKPIVNEILLKEEEQITWGQVAQLFSTLKKAQNKETGKEAAKSLGKIGLSLLGVDAIEQALTFVGNAQDYAGTAKALFKLGKDYSESELKNPKASEFKNLTGPFWRSIKLSPEISTMLDDNVEAMFINQVLLPKLQNPGAANEPIPNMDELLGKWLNDKGLAANADIQFKGNSGDLSEATMNAQEMARHKKKLNKLKKVLSKQGDEMMEYPKSLPNTVFNAKLINEGEEYPPYMYSPVGFSCAVCAAHYMKDGKHMCSAPEYKAYKGTEVLLDDNNNPITDPTKWCSNWFWPKGK